MVDVNDVFSLRIPKSLLEEHAYMQMRSDTSFNTQPTLSSVTTNTLLLSFLSLCMYESVCTVWSSRPERPPSMMKSAVTIRGYAAQFPKGVTYLHADQDPKYPPMLLQIRRISLNLSSPDRCPAR